VKNDIICIIPARKNSKRIKNKNIINFFGKPLISYSITNAKNSNLFKKVIISTDSIKIKKISLKYKAEVPFIRNKNLSKDQTLIKNVILDTIKKIKSEKTKYHCLLYPTAPLIKVKDIKNAFNKLKKNKNANGIISVSKYNSNPLRSLIIKNKFITFKYPKYQDINSNKLKSFYYDIGGFLIFKTKDFLKSKKLWMKKTIPFIIPSERAIDINDHSDLKLAKTLFKKN
jgi:pseudaminic acid cytidylyltransferase